jgi:DNA-binding SARP family transcriptional activator
LQSALDTRRHAATNEQRLTALRQVGAVYQGELADDLSPDWLDPHREAIRRDVLDSLGALIRAYGDRDPEAMLDLLEQARRLDPYNEGLYQRILRTQAQLGRYESIPRTLALLTTTLDEIGQQPSANIVRIADVLKHPDASGEPGVSTSTSTVR